MLFDLKANDLWDDCEIVQVLAVDGLRLFDRHVYPNGSISFGATNVTGIT